FGDFLTEQSWRHGADEALRQALVNLDAIPAPAGTLDVVLGAGWPGVMLHEAVGHGLEGDFNRKKTSAFAGRWVSGWRRKASLWLTTARSRAAADRCQSMTKVRLRATMC